MYDNYNYPPGADSPSAPWNQPPEPDPIEVECHVSVGLVNDQIVGTTNYWVERDDDGYRETHLEDGYADIEGYVRKEYRSIPNLLAELVKYIDKELESPDLKRHRKQELQQMRESATGWKEENFEIEDYKIIQ